MKKEMFLTLLGLELVAFAISSTGCASHASHRYTTPVVTGDMLDRTATVNGAEVGATDEYPINCFADCEVVVPVEETTTIKLPAKKRGCIPPMLLAGLVGTAGGAAFGSIMYPNDVEVSDDRVDVWFDPTWKFAAFGAATSTVITGVICYATR